MRSMVVLAFVAASLAVAGCADVGPEESSTTSAQDIVSQDDADDLDPTSEASERNGTGVAPEKYTQSRTLQRYTGDDRAGTSPIPWQPSPASGTSGGGSKND